MLPSPLLLGTTTQRDRIVRMAVLRMTVGLSVGVSPGFGAKVFGAPADQVTPTARLLGRLFAVRNVALGAWTLAVRDASRDEQRRCFQVNAAVDVVDAAVILPFLAQRGLRRTALLSTALAVSAALGWAELLS